MMRSSIKKRIIWIFSFVLIVGLVFYLALQSVIFLGIVGHEYTDIFTVPRKNQIGVVSVDGVLLDVQPLIDRLQRLKRRSEVKAILLDINSPGGAVGPTQELSSEVERVRDETDKPIISFVRNTGASGAYHVAVSGDTVVANPGSVVGSIGVMIQFIQASELVDKIGLDYEIIKSGEFKDLGSPFRTMSDDERELLQELVMDVYDQFIGYVAERREGLEDMDIEEVADGRIFTGQQALEVGLIDKTGSRREAIEVARKAADIEADPVLDEPKEKRPSPLRLMGRVVSFIEGFSAPQENEIRLLYKTPDWGGSID